MKKQLFVLLGLGLLVGMSAYAQTVNLKADVPFNFIIRGVVLSQRCASINAVKRSTL